jgi:N-methylhydantoinase A
VSDPVSSQPMVAVDVGGTFTDVVAVRDGVIAPAKVSTDVQSSDRSVLEGARRVGVEQAGVFNLASTSGLNAVITRRLPKIGVLVTAGARNVLDAGTVGRPVEYLTDPTWQRSFSDVARPLVPRYLRREIREMIDHNGHVYLPMDEEDARRQLRVLKRCNVEGVAVSLSRAWRNPVHERRLAELVREELGDLECSISSDVSPLTRSYPRVVSVVINVFMRLLYGSYTSRLDKGLRDLGFGGAFNYADCRAMLMPASYAMEKPYRLVAGGPAAGTVSSAHFGKVIGDANILCVDIGGTSCDISVVMDGEPWVDTTFELEYDIEVNALSVDIVTLGAGGGSIVAVSPSGDIRVGPDSAGADPGPACYGKGGTRPTTTDTALLMGVLDPDGFLGGEMKLDPELSRAAFEGLDTPMTFDQRVSYAWRIGLNNIAEGIFNVAIRRGIDLRDFTLMAYGAAGPMVLPSLLEMVPVRRVVVPPYPGLFSALGLISSDQVFTEERGTFLVLGPDTAPKLEEMYAAMELAVRAHLPAGTEETARFVRTFDGRLAGQGWETPFVEAPSPVTPEATAVMVSRFHDVYQVRNANRFEHMPVEVVSLRVQAVVPAAKVDYPELEVRAEGASARRSRMIPLRHLGAEEVEIAEYQRADLLVEDTVEGPAVIREAMSTTFVPAGCRAIVGRRGQIEISLRVEQGGV